MRHFIQILLCLFAFTQIGCATTKPTFFNESEKIYADDAGQGVCANVTFDCVVMGQGNFRTITSVNPTVQVVYVEGAKNASK
jgi:hypothetical protein